MWVVMWLKSAATQMFVQELVQTNNKEITKALQVHQTKKASNVKIVCMSRCHHVNQTDSKSNPNHALNIKIITRPDKKYLVYGNWQYDIYALFQDPLHQICDLAMWSSLDDNRKCQYTIHCYSALDKIYHVERDQSISAVSSTGSA